MDKISKAGTPEGDPADPPTSGADLYATLPRSFHVQSNLYEDPSRKIEDVSALLTDIMHEQRHAKIKGKQIISSSKANAINGGIESKKEDPLSLLALFGTQGGQRKDSADKNIARSLANNTLETKVRDKVLVLDYQRSTSGKGATARASRKPIPASSEIIKKIGNQKKLKSIIRTRRIHDSIPANERKYKLFECLTPLWREYAFEQLKDYFKAWSNQRTKQQQQRQGAASSYAEAEMIPRPLLEQMGESVARLDLHGAYVKVIRSTTPSFVGLEGIIALETSRTWALVTKEDEWKIIPKHQVALEVEIDTTDPKAASASGKDQVVPVTINGAAFSTRPSERSVKKWKRKLIPTTL